MITVRAIREQQRKSESNRKLASTQKRRIVEGETEDVFVEYRISTGETKGSTTASLNWGTFKGRDMVVLNINGSDIEIKMDFEELMDALRTFEENFHINQ